MAQPTAHLSSGATALSATALPCAHHTTLFSLCHVRRPCRFTYEGDASIALQSSVPSTAAFNSQCSFASGALQKFSFCYFIDATDQAASNLANYQNPNVGFEYAYGTFTALGPFTRNGRPAYRMQNMTGMRSTTFINTLTNATQVVNNNIVGLVYTNDGINTCTIPGNLSSCAGTGYLWPVPNIVYVSGTPLDVNGFMYNVNNPSVWINGTASVNKGINLETSQTETNPSQTLPLYEYYGAIGVDPNIEPNSGNYLFFADSSSPSMSGFSYAPFATTPVATSLCAALTSSPYLQAQQLTTFSFIFTASGSQSGGWSESVIGTMTVYMASITSAVTGRVGYALSGITGQRTYKGTGGTSSVTINGLAGDEFAAYGYGLGYFDSYDQLLYTTAPFVDGLGILYTFAGAAQTYKGVVQGTSELALNIFYQGGQYQELGFLDSAFATQEDVTGSFSLISDGGSCGASLSCSSGGGSSGLSGGQIAGIVVGSVVGGLLICGLCLALLCRGRGKEEKQTGAPQKMSEMEPSQSNTEMTGTTA